MGEVEILGGPPRWSIERIRAVVGAACRRNAAVRALLYGSYARGSADAYSDVDLVIVCPTERPFFERWKLFEDVLDAFPGSDLLVYTPEELEALRGRPGVVAEALREGIVLYEAAPASAAP